MDTMKAKTVTKLLLVVGMVCFVFPFVMVSCSGESVKATGVELMTCISFDDEKKFSEDDTPDGYLLAAFSLGVIGLGCAAMTKNGDQKMVISGCCATAGAISLILFRTTFWERNGLTGYEGRVTVEFLWGWTLSLISYIGAAGCVFLSKVSETQSRSKKEENVVNSFSPQISPSFMKKDILPVPPDPPKSKEELPEGFVQDSLSDISVPGEDQGIAPCAKSTLVVQYIIRETDAKVRIQNFPHVIGRDSSSCDLEITDSKVSRTHARISLKDGAVFIEDMETTNGTQVNGLRISEPIELLSGDEVVIGGAHLIFEIAESVMQPQER